MASLSTASPEPTEPLRAGLVRGHASLTAVAVLWAAFALAPELVLDGAKLLDRSSTGALVYGLTGVASFFTWWIVTSAIASLRARSPKLGWAAVVLVGPVGTLLTVGSVHYRLFFNTDIRPIAIAYFLENPRYASSLVGQSLTPALRVALVLGATFGIVALALLTRRPFPARSRPPRWAFFLVIAPIALVTIPRAGYGKYPCIAEVRGERALLQGIYARGWSEPLHALPVPHRTPVASAVAVRKPDILLVVGESLGADRMPPWNGQPALSSGLMTALEGHAAHTVWFPNAIAVAPVTAISVPSTLSGLLPDASAEDYARAPLLWHEARARGYRAGFFSAQDLHVDFFEGFYLSDGGPSESNNASDHPEAGRVNDRGIPDARTIDDAIDFAARAPHDEPIFVVVQLNATHWPCWAPDLDEVPNAAIPERCARAVHYVDRELGRLVEELGRRRDLENTVIIGTSDHGESFDGNRPARSVSYYESVLRVPLFVHLPESVCNDAPELCARLHENRGKRVSNLDIFPTVMELWGAPIQDRRPPLAGESLIGPVSDHRVMVAMAESAIWDSLADGFGIHDGAYAWIIDEFHGVRLFDLDADPDETQNLAASASAESIARMRAEIARHPRAVEVCRHVAPGILEGPWAPISW